MRTTRRKFLNQSSKALASAAILPMIPSPLASFSKRRIISPNEKITVGLIGANSMGFGDLENALKQPGVECAAICDIDDAVLSRRSADILRIQGKPA